MLRFHNEWKTDTEWESTSNLNENCWNYWEMMAYMSTPLPKLKVIKRKGVEEYFQGNLKGKDIFKNQEDTNITNEKYGKITP